MNDTEININSIMNNPLFDPFYYSNSIANSGLNNIGQLTWENAKNSSLQFVTNENKQLFIDYFLGFGAWEENELQNINELNALFIQFVSGDLNELGINLEHSTEDKIRILKNSENDDQLPLNIFYGIDKNFYYYIGS